MSDSTPEIVPQDSLPETFELTLDNGVTISGLDVVAIAHAAGDAMMAIYNSNIEEWDMKVKSDSSPLTAADLAANKVICESLLAKYPSIPIISEENKWLPMEERAHYEYFWCVDPLDGTKEFIKRNGQFTVNIGLCKGNAPIFGCVHVPAFQPIKTFLGFVGKGSYVNYPGSEDSSWKSIHVKEFSESDSGLVIVASASHNTPETQAFIEKFDNPQCKSLGSSLKLLMVAEGEAHIYPRLAPTCEWDTCASHAIVNGAGGVVVQASGGAPVTEEGSPVIYNKPNALNPFFIVYGKKM